MKNSDPRISELFGHLRTAFDVLEQIMLHPYSPQTANGPLPDKASLPAASAPPLKPEKLAYTVKEVRDLVSISRSKIYTAIKEKDLRAVRFGQRILIPAKNLQEWIESRPSA
jgi:excisionase family DNA binding protein